MNFADHFQILSHSYLIEGDHDAVEKELISIFSGIHGIKTAGNPDFWQRRFGTFAIDDAREVKELASMRKSGEGKRIFMISAVGLTREASNALLKTLEEPGEGTHFFLILPSVRRVLPTILSRSRVVSSGFRNTEEKSGSPESFLKASPSKRLALIKDMLLKLEKEQITKADIQSFIIETIELYHAKHPKSKKLGPAADISSYSGDQSASLKMILEYLALSL